MEAVQVGKIMCEYCSNIEWPALNGRRVVIGTSGSISLYRIPDLIRELKRKGADVYAGLSSSSEALVGKEVFRWATDHAPVTEISGGIEHIRLFEDSGANPVLVLAPASYNLVGKIASGISDTVPSLFFSYAFGMGIPVIVAPAMHRGMMENRIMQDNVSKLRGLGVDFVDPEMDPEKAKLSDMETIIDHVYRACFGKQMNESRILIISGRTEDRIDPVRVVTNRSTGLTGYWLARNAFRLGAKETVLVGNTHGEPPSYVESYCEIETEGLYKRVESLLEDREFDLILVPAAISDFSTVPLETKADSGKPMVLELSPREKLLNRIRKKHRGKLVAFRLSEDQEGARSHFRESDPDYIVFNSIGKEKDPFGETATSYTVFDRSDEAQVNGNSKEEATFRLLVHISEEKGE